MITSQSIAGWAWIFSLRKIASVDETSMKPERAMPSLQDAGLPHGLARKLFFSCRIRGAGIGS